MKGEPCVCCRKNTLGKYDDAKGNIFAVCEDCYNDLSKFRKYLDDFYEKEKTNHDNS